jgi:hypothetical protein
LGVLESVRKCRPGVVLVGELRDEEPERFCIARHGERTGINRIEAHIPDQPRGYLFRVVVVAAKDQARTRGPLFPSNTAKSTLLGTVPKAETTRAFFAVFATFSAPDDMRPTTSAVSSSFIGCEHVTRTFPDRSPA